MKPEHIVRPYFAKLGLAPEIADIYLALYTHGPQTISSLARVAGVERTKIYRLIDQLMTASLVEVEAHYKRGVIKAAPIANIRILIAQREHELKSLQDDLELLEQTLARNQLSNPAVRVQLYHGIEGIRHMQWNQITSDTELLSIVDKPIQHSLGKQFAIGWSEAINQQGIRVRLVETPRFRQANAAWHKQHKIPKLLRRVESRTVSPNTFPVGHNTDIWGDVVAYYNWKDGDIYGMEIYNAAIAAAQRAFFAMLWDTASPAK